VELGLALTFDRTTWAPIIQGLGNDVRTGRDRPAGRWRDRRLSMLSMGRCRSVHETVTELGIDQPIVVGHSISGAIASIYGVSYPALGIVNIDQPAEIRPFARMVRDLWPALSGEHFAKAFEPIQQSIGLDRVPERIGSRVLAI
jgi:pimeloyl-ACP methyl ester carboxylesterase